MRIPHTFAVFFAIGYRPTFRNTSSDGTKVTKNAPSIKERNVSDERGSMSPHRFVSHELYEESEMKPIKNIPFALAFFEEVHNESH